MIDIFVAEHFNRPPVEHDKVTASMNAAIFRFFFYFSA
ncbi:pheST operon leader peptide PheM [Pantoea allii]|nr:pheST operon leader peptide PheM [Pantoea allii]